MPLMPKRVKHFKMHRGRRKGLSTAGATLSFGDYGLQALQGAWLTARQLEAARIAITRYIRRGGKLWIRLFPDKSVSKKPAETRMGGGKAAPEYWVAVVKRGKLIFELSGVPRATAKEAMRLASHKLPFKTRFVARDEI